MKIRSQKRIVILTAVALTGLLAVSVGTPALAGSITYVTPSGSTTAGGAVNAEAIFTTGAGSLSITLMNLEANPTDVAQNLSDLSFTLGNGTNTAFSLSSSSAREITVNGNGTFTLGPTVSTGWNLTPSGTTSATLDVLGAAIGPAHLIIGPPGGGSPPYSNANGSIAGNGPHNPFLNQSATFTITGSGITASTTITAATFSFGTTAGQNLVTGQVPEPSALVLGLVGLGLAGSIGLYRGRRRS